MPTSRATSPIASTILLAASLAGAGTAFAAPASKASTSKVPDDIDGTWEIAVDKGAQTCRVVLRAQKSDKGDYFLGMAPACRHAMPALAKIGRWTMPDAAHLTFNEPAGREVMKLAAAGDTFNARLDARSYTLTRMPGDGRSVGERPAADAAAPDGAQVVRVAKRTAAAPEKTGDLVGRYAVMREKRDTGCMLTLDLARTKGGTRAQLAPGCRDQGIVVFDPSAWQIVKGDLVLTARAGHKTRLQKSGAGAWQKDAKDGGKPLGLKKL